MAHYTRRQRLSQFGDWDGLAASASRYWCMPPHNDRWRIGIALYVFPETGVGCGGDESQLFVVIVFFADIDDLAFENIDDLCDVGVVERGFCFLGADAFAECGIGAVCVFGLLRCGGL